jgi:hypothetical protein
MTENVMESLNNFNIILGRDSIESATVSLWYNNHPNPKFFGGHTLIFDFHIKDGKVENVSSILEG